jgi:hypothetical protein
MKIEAEIEIKDKSSAEKYRKSLKWIEDKMRIKVKETGKEEVKFRFILGSQILAEWNHVPDGKTILDEYYSLLEDY